MSITTTHALFAMKVQGKVRHGVAGFSAAGAFAKRKPTQSLAAYDYYLRGMASLHLWTKEATTEARGRSPRGMSSFARRAAREAEAVIASTRRATPAPP